MYPFLLGENLQILGQVVSVCYPLSQWYPSGVTIYYQLLLAQMAEICMVDVKAVIDDESYRCQHDVTW